MRDVVDDNNNNDGVRPKDDKRKAGRRSSDAVTSSIIAIKGSSFDRRIESKLSLKEVKLKNTIQLTGREKQVLHLIAEGKTDKQIAKEMELSKKTVHHHVGSLLNKIKVENRTQAVLQAIKLGLLS